MEIVLLGYFLICLCNIFSLGGFLTNLTIVQVYSPEIKLMIVVLGDPNRSHYCDDMGSHA